MAARGPGPPCGASPAVVRLRAAVTAARHTQHAEIGSARQAPASLQDRLTRGCSSRHFLCLMSFSFTVYHHVEEAHVRPFFPCQLTVRLFSPNNATAAQPTRGRRPQIHNLGISPGRQTPSKHLIVTTDESRPPNCQTPIAIKPGGYHTRNKQKKHNPHYRPSLKNQRLALVPSMASRVVEEALYSPSESSTASGSPLRAREPLV